MNKEKELQEEIYKEGIRKLNDIIFANPNLKKEIELIKSKLKEQEKFSNKSQN